MFLSVEENAKKIMASHRDASFRRLGGPRDRSGRVRKISPPPGFDPRTLQPVASRYTD